MFAIVLLASLGITADEARLLVEVNRLAEIKMLQERIEKLESLIPRIKRARVVRGRGLNNPVEIPDVKPEDKIVYASVYAKVNNLKLCERQLELDKKRLAELRDTKTPYRPEFRPPMSTRSVGVFADPLRVVQVIDEANMLCTPLFAGAPPYAQDTIVWIRGISTDGVVDDELVRIKSLFAVTGTKQYVTVLGGTRTVLMLESIESLIED